jgi:hypothetical protein
MHLDFAELIKNSLGLVIRKMNVILLIEWLALAYRSVVASAIEAVENLSTNRLFEFLKKKSIGRQLASGSLRIGLPEIVVFIQNNNPVSPKRKRCKHRNFQVTSAIL